jgi:hypothetical protein
LRACVASTRSTQSICQSTSPYQAYIYHIRSIRCLEHKILGPHAELDVLLSLETPLRSWSGPWKVSRLQQHFTLFSKL